VTSDRGRADEAHRVDARVLEELVDRVGVAVDHVEDALGQTAFTKQFAQANRHRRVALGRFKDHGVPSRSRCGHPQGTMIGKVERRDRGHDTDRFAYRMHVDAVGDLAENSPFMCSVSPQAYSTFSRPRASSPFASARVLPCSW